MSAVSKQLDAAGGVGSMQTGRAAHVGSAGQGARRAEGEHAGWAQEAADAPAVGDGEGKEGGCWRTSHRGVAGHHTVG